VEVFREFAFGIRRRDRERLRDDCSTMAVYGDLGGDHAPLRRTDEMEHQPLASWYRFAIHLARDYARAAVYTKFDWTRRQVWREPELQGCVGSTALLCS
jgi:hypothetical protein